MHRIFVGLFSIIFLVVIKGASINLSTSIDKDANDLTRLTEIFWSLKPKVFEEKGPLVLCQFIDKCCTNVNRFQAISSMVSSIINEHQNKNRYNKVISKCIDSTDFKNANETCPLLNKLISPSVTEYEKFMIIQHRNILMNYFRELNNLINHVYESCINEEVHALLCLSDTNLIQTCVSKILRKIYHENDWKFYQEFLIETKQVLFDLNQQLLKLVK